MQRVVIIAATAAPGAQLPNLRPLTDALAKAGFVVSVHDSTTGAVNIMPPPNNDTSLVEVVRYYMGHLRPWDVASCLVSMGLSTVSDLRSVRFSGFVTPQHDIQMVWLVKVAILQYMIENNLRLKDAVPSNIFRTPLKSLSAPGDQHATRATSALIREGYVWLELLAHVTRQEIRDIRNVNDKTLELIDGWMQTRGIRFKP